ncbi:MAG TPA: GntR family transcriptional regulator [Thermodesulfobacteriota bacterium]|nr:GntR family transcriptional regulator [Thermodesulfobacteriota bacterium]
MDDRRIPLRAVRPRTLRAQIVAWLREAIARGTLRPGERVAEPVLAARFGVSRTPVRRALDQLASQGYLVLVPRRGAVVVGLSEKELDEFYDVKALLEGHAARRAASRLTEAELGTLDALNDRLDRLAEAGDLQAFLEVHDTFHHLVLRAAGNARLEELARGLLRRFERYRLASLAQPGRMRASVEHHRAIAAALRARDPDRAEALVRASARYGEAALREALVRSRGEGCGEFPAPRGG